MLAMTIYFDSRVSASFPCHSSISSTSLRNMASRPPRCAGFFSPSPFGRYVGSAEKSCSWPTFTRWSRHRPYARFNCSNFMSAFAHSVSIEMARPRSPSGHLPLYRTDVDNGRGRSPLRAPYI